MSHLWNLSNKWRFFWASDNNFWNFGLGIDLKCWCHRGPIVQLIYYGVVINRDGPKRINAAESRVRQQNISLNNNQFAIRNKTCGPSTPDNRPSHANKPRKNENFPPANFPVHN